MIRLGYQIASEIFLILLYPFSAFVVLFIPRRKVKSKKTGRPLIIVERWMTLNIRHLYWKHYLQRQGFRVFIVNFPLNKGRFRDSASELDSFLTKKRIEDAILVGISAGALTSLIYLQERDGWKRISKFVSIGAPFRGTWSAVFLIFAYSGWELFPGSKLVQEIRSYKIKNTDRILCIKARFDEMAPFGAVLDGANRAVIDVVGHNNLHLGVRTTYRKIVEFASK